MLCGFDGLAGFIVAQYDKCPYDFMSYVMEYDPLGEEDILADPTCAEFEDYRRVEIG